MENSPRGTFTPDLIHGEYTASFSFKCSRSPEQHKSLQRQKGEPCLPLQLETLGESSHSIFSMNCLLQGLPEDDDGESLFLSGLEPYIFLTLFFSYFSFRKENHCVP